MFGFMSLSEGIEMRIQLHSEDVHRAIIGRIQPSYNKANDRERFFSGIIHTDLERLSHHLCQDFLPPIVLVYH